MLQLGGTSAAVGGSKDAGRGWASGRGGALSSTQTQDLSSTRARDLEERWGDWEGNEGIGSQWLCFLIEASAKSEGWMGQKGFEEEEDVA